MPNPAPRVLLICNDLIFTSRITGVAKDLGVPIRVVPSPDQADNELLTTVVMAIVDLSSSVGTDKSGIESLRSRLRDGTQMIGYGSHVDVDRLCVAREAGCQPVLTRSQFVAALQDLLVAV